MGTCCNAKVSREHMYINSCRGWVSALNDEFNLKRLLLLGPKLSGKSTIYNQIVSLYADENGTSTTDQYGTEYKELIYWQIVDEMKQSIKCIKAVQNGNKLLLDGMESHTKYKECRYSLINDAYIRQTIQPLLTNQTIPIELYSECFKYLFSFCGNFVDELSQNGQYAADYILNLNLNEYCFDVEFVRMIYILWDEPAIQSIYEFRGIMSIATSTKYFCDNIHKIANTENYTPTKDEILKMYVATRGWIQKRFERKGQKFIITQIGGARKERKKWVCYPHVNTTVMMFVIGMDSFDHLTEDVGHDRCENAMDDTLKLFEKVGKLEWSINCTFILLFNKIDLFKEKIMNEKIPITICETFKDYNGDQQSFEETSNYIKDMFESLLPSNDSRDIFTFFVNAMDEENIRLTLEDIMCIIVSENSQRLSAVQ
eukprot:258763_1